MRLIMTRHGQTDWNVQHRFQGQTDIPLNEAGMGQAKLLGQYLAKEEIQRAYVSHLQRARHTADLILSEREIPVQVDERLAEIRLGRLEGMGYQEAIALHGPLQGRYQDFGGESLEMIRTRVEAFVGDCLHQPGTSLIVTHGMTIRILWAVLLGQPTEELLKYSPCSCCYSEAIWENGRWHMEIFGEDVVSQMEAGKS